MYLPEATSLLTRVGFFARHIVVVTCSAVLSEAYGNSVDRSSDLKIDAVDAPKCSPKHRTSSSTELGVTDFCEGDSKSEIDAVLDSG